MTADMKLGLGLGYWGADAWDPTDLVMQAEDLGFDSVWTAEAYGSDAFSPLCWIGARTTRIKLGTGIAQISARTAASLAMTAATIDHLTGGRLLLGLGASGPQVVEGWYGQPFARPLERTREYVEILRAIFRRDKPVAFEGRHYKLPLPGGTGLGKPLRLTVHPLRREIPIYLAAEGPRNVEMAAEIADGWLPLFYSPYRPEVFALRVSKPGFDIACTVPVLLCDDPAEGLQAVKTFLAFYIGGMGARSENFHFNAISRMGFQEEAVRVQQLFLGGDRVEATRAVPDELADEIALVGPAGRIRERLGAWIESPVTHLIASTRDPEALRVLAGTLRP